jgi:hypothetical protein
VVPLSFSAHPFRKGRLELACGAGHGRICIKRNPSAIAKYVGAFRPSPHLLPGTNRLIIHSGVGHSWWILVMVGDHAQAGGASCVSAVRVGWDFVPAADRWDGSRSSFIDPQTYLADLNVNIGSGFARGS